MARCRNAAACLAVAILLSIGAASCRHDAGPRAITALSINEIRDPSVPMEPLTDEQVRGLTLEQKEALAARLLAQKEREMAQHLGGATATGSP